MTSRVLVEAIGRMDLLSHFAPSPNGKAMARAGVGGKTKCSAVSTSRGPGGHLVIKVQKGGLAQGFKL